jgi:arsenate reductase
MGRITLYHNPSCSKSRATLALLEEKGAEFDVVEYLKAPPSPDTLAALFSALPGEPGEYFRRDGHWKSLELDEADYVSADTVIGLLQAHPRLLQRPIAVRGERAVVGRPPENVLELLD